MTRQRKKDQRKGKPTPVTAHLHLRYTNEELVDVMRKFKQVREQIPDTIITCAIEGFGNDRRELGEIPEVRAFCRRLVCTGFISWLELSTSVPALTHPALKGVGMFLGLGALEVWLISEGLVGKAGTVRLNADQLKHFAETVLPEANEQADRLLGEETS